jgi:hypothetical protein
LAWRKGPQGSKRLAAAARTSRRKTSGSSRHNWLSSCVFNTFGDIVEYSDVFAQVSLQQIDSFA